MGESQWFQPTLKNDLTGHVIVLADFVIEYGKFYDIEHPFVETQSAQGAVIRQGGQYEWGHCGRQGSPSGTTGYFGIRLDRIDGEQLARIYWNCPYIGNNVVRREYVNSDYRLFIEHFDNPIYDGALGKGQISIVKKLE